MLIRYLHVFFGGNVYSYPKPIFFKEGGLGDRAKGEGEENPKQTLEPDKGSISQP